MHAERAMRAACLARPQDMLTRRVLRMLCVLRCNPESAASGLPTHDLAVLCANGAACSHVWGYVATGIEPHPWNDG